MSGSPPVGVHEGRARPCRELLPERRVGIRTSERLVGSSQIHELPAFEGQGLETKRLHVDARVLDRAAGVVVSAPRPAPLDEERHQLSRRDPPDVTGAEGHLTLLAPKPDSRRLAVHLQHDSVLDAPRPRNLSSRASGLRCLAEQCRAGTQHVSASRRVGLAGLLSDGRG